MISEYAIVETDALGDGCVIHPFAVVRRGAVLGRDVVVHPHAVIESGVVIGDAVEIFPGAYLGKEPKGAGATARTPKFERRVAIGAGCSIGPNAVIYYDVRIGDNTLIGDGASIREQCVIGSRCIVSRHVSINYNARVGDRTKIMDLSHVTGNCVIGSDVFISVNVVMTNDRAMGAKGYAEGEIKGPTIGDGAVIGVGANLLPGVVIGAAAQVLAGAVVSKDVPEAKVVAGAPARVIRSAE